MGAPSDERTFERRYSPASWVFAAIPISELRRHSLLAPDSLAGAARVFTEMAIAFIKVAIDCAFGFLDAPVVAVMDNGPRHSTMAFCILLYPYPAFLRYAAHSAGGYWARILALASEIAS
jgi:hypothetical protein